MSSTYKLTYNSKKNRKQRRTCGGAKTISRRQHRRNERQEQLERTLSSDNASQTDGLSANLWNALSAKDSKLRFLRRVLASEQNSLTDQQKAKALMRAVRFGDERKISFLVDVFSYPVNVAKYCIDLHCIATDESLLNMSLISFIQRYSLDHQRQDLRLLHEEHRAAFHRIVLGCKIFLQQKVGMELATCFLQSGMELMRVIDPHYFEVPHGWLSCGSCLWCNRKSYFCQCLWPGVAFILEGLGQTLEAVTCLVNAMEGARFSNVARLLLESRPSFSFDPQALKFLYSRGIDLKTHKRVLYSEFYCTQFGLPLRLDVIEWLMSLPETQEHLEQIRLHLQPLMIPWCLWDGMDKSAFHAQTENFSVLLRYGVFLSPCAVFHALQKSFIFKLRDVSVPLVNNVRRLVGTPSDGLTLVRYISRDANLWESDAWINVLETCVDAGDPMDAEEFRDPLLGELFWEFVEKKRDKVRKEIVDWVFEYPDLVDIMMMFVFGHIDS